MIWPAPRKSERVELVCTCHTTILWRIPLMFLYSVRINQKLSCRYTPIVIIIIIRAPTVAPPVRPPPAVQPVTGEDHRDDNYDEQERVHGVMRELPSVPRAIPSVASFFEPSVRSSLPSSCLNPLIAFSRSRSRVAPPSKGGRATRHGTGWPLTRLRQQGTAGTPAPEVPRLGELAPTLLSSLSRALGFLIRFRRNPQSRGSSQGGQSWHTQPDRCST